LVTSITDDESVTAKVMEYEAGGGAGCGDGGSESGGASRHLQISQPFASVAKPFAQSILQVTARHADLMQAPSVGASWHAAEGGVEGGE
jgi:hypothetical protein